MPTRLGDMAVGSTVKIKENGTPQEYIIVHHGNPNPAMYDASCNGTWLNRKDAISNYGSWGNDYNQYGLSNIHTSLQDEWPKRYEANIKKLFKSVKIPYGTGKGNSSVNTGSDGLTCTFFAPSALELGAILEYYMANDGIRLSYFIQGDSSEANQKRAAKYLYWTRTPVTNERETAYTVKNDGEIQGLYPTASGAGIRPMCILPDDLSVDDSGNLTADIYIDPPSTVTAPSSVTKTEQFTVAWSSVQDATEYILERKVNNGEYSQLYTGLNTSYFDTALSDWTSVQYRVKVNKNGNYSGYKESTIITVKNIDFTVSGIRIPKNVLVGDSINITWDPTPFANTYKVERRINDLSWELVHVGPTTTYSDIAGPWKTVQYRIVAGLNDQYGTTFTETSVVTVDESSLGGMIRKERVHRKNSDGIYDVIHYETECSVVIMSDGTKVEDKLNEIQNGQLVPKIIASYNK